MSVVSTLEPGLFVGEVRHRRFTPRRHEFRMPIFMVLLDPERIGEYLSESLLFRSTGRMSIAQFRRSDYIAPHEQSIHSIISDRLAVENGVDSRVSHDRPILMLTHLRQFGYLFNPVTIYYQLNQDRTEVTGMVAEITNTPWKERHAYALPVENGKPIRDGWQFSFSKSFHVSPFLPMTQHYRWQLSTPSDRLMLHFQNFDADPGEGDHPVLDATLMLERHPLNTASLSKAVLQHPFMTARVIARIHYEALRLWLKRVPVYDHPLPIDQAPDGTNSSSATLHQVTRK